MPICRPKAGPPCAAGTERRCQEILRTDHFLRVSRFSSHTAHTSTPSTRKIPAMPAAMTGSVVIKEAVFISKPSLCAHQRQEQAARNY